MITLYVGENRTKYFAYERSLCQLEFFRAALEGQFKEALEKTISMPEDDPEAVSALIQWLYTGNYTYDSNRLQRQTMILRAAPEEPSEGLLEGLFHLEVCVVASKYDCAKLSEKAKKRFYVVSQKRLDEIDNLRLWRAHNTSGLLGFPLLLSNSPYRIQAVRGWVEELFDEHRVELASTGKQFPDLILNMLEDCAHDLSE